VPRDDSTTDLTAADRSSRRLFFARLTGGVAAVVALGGIGLAVTLAPPGAFSWTGSNLSDLGTTPGVSLLFNGGLVAGGLLGLPYAVALSWQPTGRAPEGGRSGSTPEATPRVVTAGTYAVTVLLLALVGLFPAGTAVHTPAAIGFFLGVTLLLGWDGVRRSSLVASGPRDRRQLWWLPIALAVVHVLVWVAWIVGGTDGLAIPETVGALAFAAWVWVVGPVPVVDRRESRRQ
jgi:hypothetical membrane protein